MQKKEKQDSQPQQGFSIGQGEDFEYDEREKYFQENHTEQVQAQDADNQELDEEIAHNEGHKKTKKVYKKVWKSKWVKVPKHRDE